MSLPRAREGNERTATGAIGTPLPPPFGVPVTLFAAI